MTSEKVRIDKWLWAARFFKTRSLASEAINNGKVSSNGVRVKPSRSVQVGDELLIRRGPFEFTVVVRGVSEQRGPAPQAQTLYEESAESVAKRQLVAEQIKLQAPTRPQKRPDKRSRRQIIRFTKGSNADSP